MNFSYKYKTRLVNESQMEDSPLDFETHWAYYAQSVNNTQRLKCVTLNPLKKSPTTGRGMVITFNPTTGSFFIAI